MAEKIYLTDDLDGPLESAGRPVRSVVVGIDDRRVRLDLTDENRAKLDEALAPYLAVATNDIGLADTRRANGYRSREDRERAKSVRAWARQQGYQLKAGGRIPTEITELYRKSHGG